MQNKKLMINSFKAHMYIEILCELFACVSY